MQTRFNYGPTTPAIQAQMATNVFNNFQQAFTPNTPLIDATDFTNRKQVLHNNLEDNLFSERVVEYTLMMNSMDRDVKKFPSPFFYQVSLGNYNVTPYIDQYFTNVKYVTLNSVILPRTIAIDTTHIDLASNKTDIYPTHSIISGDPPIAVKPQFPTNNLALQPYLLLRVKELSDFRLLGTDPLLSRDTFMLFPDQRLGDMYRYKCRRNTIIYPNSLLKNLSMLTLEILDAQGKQITILDNKGNKIINNNIGINVPYDFNSYTETFYTNPTVDYTKNNMQVIYDFTFGVIENELSTKTNYNKT